MAPPRTAARPSTDSRRDADPGVGAVAAPPPDGRRRVVVEGVRPQVDGGRYPAKASLGEPVTVTAVAYAEGHDLIGAEVRHRGAGDRGWTTVPLSSTGNDRWSGEFPVTGLGVHRFEVRADVDRWRTWRRDLAARAVALQEVATELLVGADLCQGAAGRARGGERRLLESVAAGLRSAPRGLESDLAVEVALDHGGTVAGLVADEHLADLLWRHRDADHTVVSDRLSVLVEPELARFSTWYELFPRSTAGAERHGTLADVVDRLEYVSQLGADVLYLPPIHPIGVTHRKGPNGRAAAGPGDPGSPWAIGSVDGGHTAVHPELGTLEDVDRLVAAAAERGISLALDLAFQCSPDHPWVTEHPEWFRRRPDGTIRFAENPPKRYEDIYPFDFDSDDWEGLWIALADVVRFWVHRGIRVFRVDNPHTKPFAFWEWLLRTVRADHPEVVFLAEAFTRPAVLERLAAVGFSQSYTYFTWRETRWELRSYLEELVGTDVADRLRPNCWPNTPDILPGTLQTGGTPAFVTRLVLAATLAASYGIYGPAFELQEHVPREPGSEEYLDSEKYQLRHWDLGRTDSLAAFVGRINRIRRDHPALQRNRTLRFHDTDNDRLLAYSKTHGADTVVVVVNLDSHAPQSGWVDLDLESLGLEPGATFAVRDLLTGARFEWTGAHNFVLLDPDGVPAHVLVVEPASGPSR